MKLSNAGCATLAPALSSAAAFAMPEPTRLFAVAADNWSPAPTAAPRFSIFGRDALQANEGSTFGYVSGLSASPVACPNSQIWATNTYFGVHGCCPSSNLSACTIHTTCIASTAMSAFCTDDACSSNSAAAKCTASTAQECYKYLIDYGSTIMTQHGCTYSGFTSTIPHTYGLTSTPFIIITVTAPPVSTSTSIRTSSSTGNSGGEKKHSLGPIVGGTIGGCTILSLVALAAFVIHRRRSKLKTAHRAAHPPPISQYQHDGPTFDPHGFQTTNGWTEQDIKTWQHTAGVDRPATGQYVGVSEVHGEDRAVEVEAPEKTKSGHWTVPGVAPVEAEARLVRK